MNDLPRPSATVCVLYQGDSGPEVLMVRRSRTARFMPGSWVFPGGVVDPSDHTESALAMLAGLPPGSDLGPWLAAAFREVVEETGVWLTDPPLVELPPEEPVFDMARRLSRVFRADRAVYFANWITPTMVPVRFDARFFLAAIDRRLDAQPDGVEIDAAEFVTPAQALRRARSGAWRVPFPTLRALEQLADFDSVDAGIAEWQHREVEPIRPRMRVASDGSLEIALPGERLFEELDDVAPDPEELARAARLSAERGSPIAEVVDED